ncbi:MAG: hypothetical protein WD225_02045 [Ilumatobacteraceae bacterium]
MSGTAGGDERGGYGYGYDPARIVALRTRTIEAIDDLRSIRCDDPLADDALRVVRLMCRNLEESWLPLIEAIHASRAMVTWRRAVGIDDDGALTLTRLVEHFGATSTWTGTNGLDEWTDARLVRRLGRVVDRFRRSAARHGDLGDAWGDLAEVLDELAHRLADDDGRLGRRLWEDLGTSGVEGMIAVLDVTGHTTDTDLLDGVGTDAATADRTEETLATVLGAVAAAGSAARHTLVDQAGRSTHLAGLVADHPDAVDGITLVALTAEMVAYSTGTGSWSDRPRVLDVHHDTGELLHAVATDPGLALQLLADPTAAAAVAVGGHLDDDAVEATVAAALSAPAADPDALGDALEVLTTLVSTSGQRDLDTGTRRGIALAAGSFLPSIAPVLDARLPVDVTVEPVEHGDDAATVIRLGEYDEVAGMIGQVVDDEAAQLALGVVVGNLRADQLDRAGTAIADRPGLDVADARAQISGALADISRVLVLIEHGAGQRDDLLAFRHGVANARTTAVIDLLGSMVSWHPAATPVARRVASLTTSGLTAAIGAAPPPAVPDTGLDARLAVDFLASIVALPLHDRAARARLGLDGIGGPTWQELDGLLDELDRAGDDDADRSRIRSHLRAVVDTDPVLDAYVETIAAASGESALARP